MSLNHYKRLLLEAFLVIRKINQKQRTRGKHSLLSYFHTPSNRAFFFPSNQLVLGKTRKRTHQSNGIYGSDKIVYFLVAEVSIRTYLSTNTSPKIFIIVHH